MMSDTCVVDTDYGGCVDRVRGELSHIEALSHCWPLGRRSSGLLWHVLGPVYTVLFSNDEDTGY